jgi:hypothetical protein
LDAAHLSQLHPFNIPWESENQALAELFVAHWGGRRYSYEADSV